MNTAPDGTLANLQQNLEALQRQLDERTAERDESLARETATAEVLGVINAAHGNLAPVFDAMLAKAMELCEAAFGTLHTRDGEFAPLVAHHNVPPAFIEFLTRQPPRLRTILGDALRDGSVVHIADVAAGYRRGVRLNLAGVELGGFRTLLGVPLLKDGATVGVLVIYREEVRPFTDRQITLLRNFATQAVIAMENARLLGELRERTEELTRCEAELHNSEERYALAMRAINEGVYEEDLATGEMYYSPRVCELVGLQVSDLRTMKDWIDRIHPDDRGGLRKAVIAHYKGETDRLAHEYRYRHADGTWHWALTHGIALKNQAGRVYPDRPHD